MKRNIRIFLQLSLFSIKTAFQHRIGVITFTLGKIIRFLISFLFIYFLVSKAKIFVGYTVNQTFIFFLTYNVIDTFTQLLFREVYRFKPLITSGAFDAVLIKPYHPFLRVLLGGIDILDFIMLIPYIGILIFFILKQPSIDFIHIILFIAFCINAVIIATSFHIIILTLVIFTNEIDNTIMIYRDFTRMVSFPIDIYKEPVRSFLMFVIPVGIMMSVPVKALFNLLSLPIYIISIIISMTLMFFSLWLWNKALMKYQSWGG